MGIGQVLTMPLFFASNAIYPLNIMPPWLRLIASLNPLTYLVDALRGLMVLDEQSAYGLGFDCGVLMLVFVALLAAAVRLYPKLVQ
jgi:ABC-2 type transport system permease protein